MANAESLVHFWAENISQMANPTIGEFGVGQGDVCLLKGYPRFFLKPFWPVRYFHKSENLAKNVPTTLNWNSTRFNHDIA